MVHNKSTWCLSLLYTRVELFLTFLSVFLTSLSLTLSIPCFIISWQIRFIDNTDPAGIDHQIAQLGSELASTLVIVISKVVMCLVSFFFR